jgi:peptidoglycan/LPS O-acetylase OafA/YrhL
MEKVKASEHALRPTSRSIPYRADLDGLRGIAIMMVVYFHNFELYELVPTSFGFLGVDIFFVLSGYLITTIINTQLDKGTFSFSAFYARRVKRLFPALITIFAIALIWGFLVMDPFFFQHLGSNIFYGALSLANVTFAPDAGFFDVSRTVRPFIPLWSLSLEEQFYLILPALLKFMRPLNLWRWIPFFILAVLSFGIQSTHIPSILNIQSLYYDPFARFWELFVGVILALSISPLTQICHAFFNSVQKIKLFSKVSFHDCLSFLGTYAIVGTIAMTQSQENLPFKTLFVCVGTALLIMAGPKAWINQKILSNRFLVAIGLISYPLYIIHWFLVGMISMTYATNHKAINIILHSYKDPMIMIMITLTGVILSALIYRYVEQPLRYSRHTPALLMAMMILMMGGGLAFHQRWRPWHKHLPYINSVQQTHKNQP